MVEEEVANSTSEVSSATTTEQTPTTTSPSNPNPNGSSQIRVVTAISVEATIQSSAVHGGTDSTCNNNNNNNNNNNTAAEAEDPPAVSSDGDHEKTLEFADELMDKGSTALKENDYGEAAECFSRALEIRVAHYGELAPECVNAYYQYGRALLYKSQEETDPLGAVPKKEESDKDVSVKNAANGDSSIASVSSNTDQDGSSNPQEEAVDDASGGKYQEEDADDSDAEDMTEAEEDESDLDLAWKMLDLARAISEKHSDDTMEKADILSALAEVSLEREDIETALIDYHKALIILERIVEADSRHIAALNFQICLCLEIGSKPQEAISYCQKAISICKSRLQRLTNEVKGSSESATSSTISEIDDGVQQSSNGIQTDKMVTDKEAEIEALTGLLGDLEKKLEDLQQLALNPKSILSEILGSVAARAGGSERSASPAVMGSSQMGTADSSAGFDSPTVSTAHTNGAATAAGVTHLGVVGRGVKRVLMSSGTAESAQAKKPTLDPTSGKGEGSAS